MNILSHKDKHWWLLEDEKGYLYLSMNYDWSPTIQLTEQQSTKYRLQGDSLIEELMSQMRNSAFNYKNQEVSREIEKAFTQTVKQHTESAHEAALAEWRAKYPDET